MNFFEERIIKDGVVKTDTILKVDSFLNHRIDTALLDRIGEEFKRRFDGKRINKILTIEASGIGIACITALHFGVPMVDFSGFDGVSIFSLPKVLPVSLEFKPDAIIAFILIFLVSATETIGDTSAIAASGLGRTVKEKEISGSIACDGIVSSLSSLIGCMPITSFSQNVGLVAMTKVVNRIAIASGAAIMILAGLFPVFGALIATLPSSVLGGCTIIMFANIIVSGLDMFRRCGLTKRNLVVLAFSLSFGLGFTQVPGIFDVFPEIVKTVLSKTVLPLYL